MKRTRFIGSWSKSHLLENDKEAGREAPRARCHYFYTMEFVRPSASGLLPRASPSPGIRFFGEVRNAIECLRLRDEEKENGWRRGGGKAGE